MSCRVRLPGFKVVERASDQEMPQVGGRMQGGQSLVQILENELIVRRAHREQADRRPATNCFAGYLGITVLVLQ